MINVNLNSENWEYNKNIKIKYIKGENDIVKEINLESLQTTSTPGIIYSNINIYAEFTTPYLQSLTYKGVLSTLFLCQENEKHLFQKL